MIILIVLSLVSYVNAAATCAEYCTGKGYHNGYCFNYDDPTKSEDAGWVEHAANEGACTTDLTKCNYDIVAIGCHDLDDGSKNICGDCSAMRANIWCNCYKTMDCPTNCRSECKMEGCKNSQELSSDATCQTSCKEQDCRGKKCTGGSCTAAPGLGETWSGGVCYFGITYVKNANCPGQTGAAGYCSCWRSQACPDTSDEGLEGMAENKCDANVGCKTSAPGEEVTNEEEAEEEKKYGVTSWDSEEVLNRIKTAVYTIVMTLYCLVLYVAAAVAALFIILTGVKYMSSDEANSRAESRRRMVYAIAGLMVIALACPLVNVLLANTNIGIPDADGNIVPCRNCPYIDQITSSGGGGGWSGGGGSTTGGSKCGSWFTPERIKQAKGFKECSATEPCASGVCATAGTDYRCFPKISNGCSIDESDLTPLSNIKEDLCVESYADGDICSKSLKCTTPTGCDKGKYCSTAGICESKVGVDASCSSTSIIGGTADPSIMCQSDICINGECAEEGSCDNMGHCDSDEYCGEDERKCLAKLRKGECKDSWVRDGTANDMCKSGTCDTSKNPDQCVEP